MTKFKIIMRKKRVTHNGLRRTKPQFYIRLLAGNNEIEVAGEGLDEVHNAHETCASIWNGLGRQYAAAMGVPLDEGTEPGVPYTEDSL